MRLLFAMPYRKTTPPALLVQAGILRAKAIADAVADGDCVVDVALFEDDAVQQPGDAPYASNARARNALLDIHLLPHHTHVLWVDADLVAYPQDIIRRLAAHGGVAAPAIYLEREAPGRWYDTAGFIEVAGQHTPVWPPHFSQPGPIVDLLSVGCLYLIPADVYRQGARYAPAPPHVEHWPVMRRASELGHSIVCDLRLEAFHAYLPHYGQGWHDGHQ